MIKLVSNYYLAFKPGLLLRFKNKFITYNNQSIKKFEYGSIIMNLKLIKLVNF